MFDFLILIITLIFFLLIEKEIVRFNFFPIDKPDRIKKIHLKPTSLSGGIFICTYTILILIFFYLFKLENIDYLKTIILLSFFSFCVGFYDDKFFLKPIYKLIINGLIIFFFIKNFSFLNIDNINSIILKKNILIGFYSYFFTTLCFLLLINAFNMTDGINSLSVGITIIWLLMIIYFFNPLYIKIIIYLILFLIYIFYKIYRARFFLGDSGTHFLSTFVGCILIYEYNIKPSEIYIEQIFIILMIPGIDMLRLFVYRIYNKKNPLAGDRNHFHHILDRKFGLKKTLIIYYLIMIIPVLILEIFKVDFLSVIVFTIFLYFGLLYISLIKSFKST